MGLDGFIPQGPSGNSIGFWFPSQRKSNFAKSEKLFCKIIWLMPQKQFSLYANFNFPSSFSLFFPTTRAPPPPSKYREKKERETRKCPFFKGLREVEKKREEEDLEDIALQALVLVNFYCFLLVL